jgi:hypothetical protein
MMDIQAEKAEIERTIKARNRTKLTKGRARLS